MAEIYMFILIFWTNVLTVQSQVQGDVRLTGSGSNQTQGRVEIFYSGEWGGVCDDFFENVDASIVCKQLGLPSDTAEVITNEFGQGSGPILLDDVKCSGTESRLDECRHRGWGVEDCQDDETVAIRCQTRAVGPTAPALPTTTKAPTVVQDSNYTFCCDNRKSAFPADWLSACRDDNRKSYILNGERLSCPAGTTPDSRIRLKGPSNKPWIGVVQVLKDNQWGGVCDNDWGFDEAKVVCRSLCYDPQKALPASEGFDTSNITEPMTLKRVNCNGTETSIVDCDPNNWAWVPAGNQCRRSEMARVMCEEFDNSPPNRPEPIMDCSEGFISASFSTITDPYLQSKHISVFNQTCNAEVTNTTDFVQIKIPFNGCGTKAETNATHIIYKNSVEYLPTHISGSVMHSNTYIFKLQCEFPRNVIDNGRPIIPLTETVTQTAEGSFKVDMQFWTGNPITDAPVQKYPLNVTLGAFLSSGLQLKSQVDKNLKLIVPECYATPTSNIYDTRNYSLFSDKCEDDDSVILIPINDTMYSFRYRTFKFVGLSEVHIHCNAMLCLKSETDPECDRSCLKTTTTATTTSASTSTQSARRRRRSASREIIHVSSGTLIMFDPNQPSVEITRGEEEESVIHSTRFEGLIKSSPTTLSRTKSDDSNPTDKVNTRSSVTPAHVENTVRPPYLAEVETVFTGDGSGASATFAFKLYCLLILVIITINFV